MDIFFQKLKTIALDSSLRNRILFVIGALVIFRFVGNIPIPGVDEARLASFLAGSQFFGLLNIFSGGGLSNLSILMLGVGPYITASIIMQLLTMIFPKLKEMYQEDGQLGRRKFAQYSRLLSLPLAALQAFGLLFLLRQQGIIVEAGLFAHALDIIVVSAGAIFLMWLGELMTEYGIGNGISILIFAGIVASAPTQLSQLYFSFTPADAPLYLGFIAVALVIVAGVVIITEAERPIPVTYAKRVRGMKVYGGGSTYLPLRVNQAGVMPIIFALSILLFPQMVVSFLSGIDNATIASIAGTLSAILQNQWVYGSFYFVLVFLFTYFYTAVTFDPDQISTNLQKSGAFIPGVRPGPSTSDYLGKILLRLTLVGALFLAVIAVLPLILQAFTGVQALAIGGTSLLIVVSVVIDFVKQLDAQLSMREY
ncbi:MAG: preprotein translocase subunit SecY [Candidatus Vogelbacteria bacterium CG10_big_fil_rev_8_21_14_0_10_51_16]|uniref:Protein translocase subunit SecY n=1 Tax=Candidatus Vogelbacteria bacterium CG10_big_fil_rev_8_21_14_0_10_51_16 TaxID=1975045 RepID=A0A2H0RF91_9BACT|nr:MAG: preprotein translocase subunit SecY [Candidatus Vogelbacteria bacterium CG10_big_fil_rev_8_21_14_0_10_51_16]